MVPRLWAFGEAEPLTPNGKVDRKAIARLLAGAGGNRDGGQDEEAARQPETPLESFVVSLWQEALGKEDIHPGTNFFRAGGDSLKAMLIHGRLTARLPVDLSLTAIFTAPTVRGLAGAVLAEVARRARAI